MDKHFDMLRGGRAVDRYNLAYINTLEDYSTKQRHGWVPKEVTNLAQIPPKKDGETQPPRKEGPKNPKKG